MRYASAFAAFACLAVAACGGSGSSSNGGSNTAEASADPAPAAASAPPVDKVKESRPADEAAFLQALADGKAAFGKAPNDMAKGGTRPARKAAICAALTSPDVTGWTGKIVELKANSEGKGVLTIDLGDGTKVKTWNNAFSDTGSDTLIDSASDLFKAASALSKGNAVKFSGSFFDDDTDCVKDMSLFSLESSMTKPEFLTRFTGIEKL